MDYDGDVCVWRGVVVRVIDVDDDGGDVEVCYILTGVVVGGALHRPDRATQSPFGSSPTRGHVTCESSVSSQNMSAAPCPG